MPARQSAPREAEEKRPAAAGYEVRRPGQGRQRGALCAWRKSRLKLALDPKRCRSQGRRCRTHPLLETPQSAATPAWAHLPRVPGESAKMVTQVPEHAVDPTPRARRSRSPRSGSPLARAQRGLSATVCPNAGSRGSSTDAMRPADGGASAWSQDVGRASSRAHRPHAAPRSTSVAPQEASAAVDAVEEAVDLCHAASTASASW